MPLPWVKEEIKSPIDYKPLPKAPKAQSELSSKKEEIIISPTVKKTTISDPLPKKEETIEVPKVSIKKLKTKLNTGTISIKKALNNAEETNQLINQTAKDHFTHDQLMVLWKAYTDTAKEEGKKTLHAAMAKNKPNLLPNFNIEIKVDNRVQEETVSKEKPFLLEFLKTELNNFSVELNTVVTKQKNEIHLYTDRDKFKELVKSNPDLLYLKEKLNLDFDF